MWMMIVYLEASLLNHISVYVHCKSLNMHNKMDNDV